MKKAKMLLVAALVFGVILSSYGVSGTYAKYTSTGQFTDTGRVAKWGITMDGATFKEQADLFSTTYNNDAIKSGGSDKVIGPGAYGSYTFKLDVKGAPEVAWQMDAVVSVKLPTDISSDQIKFALKKKGEEGALQDGQGTFANYDLTSEALEKAIAQAITGEEAASGTSSKAYAANASVASVGGEYTIYWMWDFDAETVGTNDGEDTTAGNNSANGTDEKLTVSVKATATQTKTAPGA